MDNPLLHKEDSILDFPNENAERLAFDLFMSCCIDKDPDAAYESVSDIDFDKEQFDDFMDDLIATESISTNYGKLINYEKEIKMAGNAMSKEAGKGINLLPGTDGFATSAPRKKDGQYYTRATLAFSDGQAVRIMFYDPDRPEDKLKYPSNVVSFQVFLNKKDITAQLVKGGGKDYGPRKFGKIIGKLLEKNSEKFQKKNAEIRAQKEEMAAIDKEISELDKQISSVTSEASQAQERGVFLKKQHEEWKAKSEAATAKRVEAEKAQKAIDETMEETESGKTWVEGKTKKFVGKKYDPDMGTKDAAKAIREEIKAAQKAGQIIDAGAGTYSVTMERYSMGSSVNVVLKKLPEDVELFSDTWKDFLRSGSQDIPAAYLRYSEPVKDTIKKIEEIISQYQKTAVSLEPDDYSSTNFHSDVTVDTKLHNDESEKIKSEVDTGGEVETTPPRDELIRILTEEFKKLKADPDTPEFELSLRVGKKKDGSAGKVSLDLKRADVPTLEALDYLKLAINNRVAEHTDNYSLNADKASALITGAEEDWHTKDIPLKGTAVVEGEKPLETLARIAKDAVGAITKIQETGGEPLYAYLLPSTDSNNGAVRLFPDDQKKPDGWEMLGNEAFRANIQNKSLIESRLKDLLRNAPILATGGTTQEQVTDTGITQADPPPEEAGRNNRDIGSEYEDRDGVKKLVTHEIDGKTVSAVQEKEYVFSAYLRNGKWVTLPVEQKTLISEDDLKTAISRSEEAYQISDDILDGNYDSQGADKVDQLLDEIADVIEDETVLNRVADYLTRLITEKFTASQQPASA